MGGDRRQFGGYDERSKRDFPRCSRRYAIADTGIKDTANRHNRIRHSKSLVSRPRIFESVEAMQAPARAYLDKNADRLTMAGLCNALGIPRQTLHEYEKREEFSDLIKSWRAEVEACVEATLLYGKNQTGAIFWLKNHAGYKDTQHTENNHNVKAVLSDEPLTDDEWEKQNG